MAWTLAFILASTGCGKRGTRSCSDFWGCETEDPPWEPLDFGPPPDLGPPDAGPVLGADGSTVACTEVIGASCTDGEDCGATNAHCLRESTYTTGVGDSADPVVGLPDGGASGPYSLFVGGYCTTSVPFEGGTPAQCNVLAPAPDAVCGECGRCVDYLRPWDLEPADGFLPGFCALRCEPSLSANECREGYTCDLTRGVCLPGCRSDDQCRIARVETNGVDGLQSPFECEFTPERCTPSDCEDPVPATPEACTEPESNFDRLVYDTESEATCDPITLRCVNQPSDPSAAGGDPCSEDAQCEPGGRCIEETDDGRWVGGSCTKDRCDLAGNECANGGVCGRLAGERFTIRACLQGCTVGGFDGSAPETWVADGSARSTCREGYGCTWIGEAPGGEANNGACTPVRYAPAVTTPNVGDACESDGDCWSPFGRGECLRAGPGFAAGYCTVRGCDDPWLTEGDTSASLCGAGAACVGLDETDPAATLCVRTCSTGDDCDPGLGCVDFTSETKACWGWCETSADCRTDERCARAGTDDAHCVRGI